MNDEDIWPDTYNIVGLLGYEMRAAPSTIQRIEGSAARHLAARQAIFEADSVKPAR